MNNELLEASALGRESAADISRAYSDANPTNAADISKLGPTDAKWNDIYKWALSAKTQSDEKHFWIKITDNSNGNENKSGYFYTRGDFETHDVSTRKARRALKKQEISFKKEDIGSTDQAHASMIAASDVDSVIYTLKRMPEYSKMQFTKQQVPAETVASYRLADTVADFYFSSVVANSPVNTVNNSAITYIDSARGIINQVVRGFSNNPLVGNPYWMILARFYKESFSNFNAKTARVLNNLLADRIVNTEDAIQGNSFVGRILFNPSLWRLSESEMEDIFGLFNRIRSKTNYTTDLLKEYTKSNINREIFAQHLILIVSGDMAKALCENDRNIDPSAMKPIPDEDCKTLNVRAPGSIKALLALCSEGDQDDLRQEVGYFLRVGPSDGITRKVFEPERINEVDDTTQDVLFTKVDLDDNEFMSVVFGRFNKNSGSRGDVVSTKGSARMLQEYIADLRDISRLKGLAEKDDGSGTRYWMAGNYTVSMRIEHPSQNVFRIVHMQTKWSGQEETQEEPAEETTDQKKEKLPDGYLEVTPDGQDNGTMVTGSTVQIGDMCVGEDGKRYEVTAENIGNGKWDVKSGSKIWRKQSSETTATAQNSSEVTPEQKEVGRKIKTALDKIDFAKYISLKNAQERRSYLDSLGLTQEEKNLIAKATASLMRISTSAAGGQQAADNSLAGNSEGAAGNAESAAQ